MISSSFILDLCKLLCVTVFVLETLLQGTQSCSCMPSHSQELYCKADFVLVGTIKGVKNVYQSNEFPENKNFLPRERHYRIRVHRTFKGNENELYRRANKKYIITGGSGASCGVKLDTRKTYLLAGKIYRGQLTINICGWIQEYKTIENHQKKFLKFKYKQNCNSCKVLTCFSGHCQDYKRHFAADVCLWNFSALNDCYQHHGLCHVKHGVCQWMRNRQIKVCLKNQGLPIPKKKSLPTFDKSVNTNEVEISPSYRSRETNNRNDVGPPGFLEP